MPDYEEKLKASWAKYDQDDDGSYTTDELNSHLQHLSTERQRLLVECADNTGRQLQMLGTSGGLEPAADLPHKKVASVPTDKNGPHHHDHHEHNGHHDNLHQGCTAGHTRVGSLCYPATCAQDITHTRLSVVQTPHPLGCAADQTSADGMLCYPSDCYPNAVATSDFTQCEASSVNTCPEGQVKTGLLCYEPCATGYDRWDVGVCRETCPAGSTEGLMGVTCECSSSPLSACPEGQVQTGLFCYEPCATGYTSVLGVCWETCLAGSTDTGVTCECPSTPPAVQDTDPILYG